MVNTGGHALLAGPLSAFLDGALVPAHGHSMCEWKGQASYLDVVGGTQVRPRAAWSLLDPDVLRWQFARSQRPGWRGASTSGR